MKKQFKLLLLAALVLVAVMAFTVLVSASPEAPTGDVTFTEGTHFFKVSISDVNYYYADLAAAVTDVPEGGTVTQLAAVDYSAYKGTGSAVTWYAISGDKSYTLNGAGFTIKTPTGKGLQISGSTATAVVTLQNAVLSGAGGYCLDTNASGTVKLINCSLTATHYVIHVRKAGTVWLADDAESSTDKNTLTATSTSTSEGYAAVAVGSGAVGAALLSDNATITMPAANGILLNGAASVTLNSGTTILGCASRQTIYIGCANTDLYKITVNGGSYQGPSFLNTNKACNYEVEVNDVDLSGESFTYGIRVNGANAKMKITLKNFKINASSYTVYVQKAADLTLVLDGSKMLSATKNVVYVAAASTLDLQLKNGSMLSADTSHTVYFATSTTATLTLDDTSKITSAYAGTSEFNGGTIMVKATTTLTLRGTGVIENTATGSYAHVIHVYDAPGNLVMQGCTLSTNGTGADKNGAVILHGAGNVLEMTGGTINGKATQAVFAYAKASISISGGSLVSTGQSPIKTTADAGTSINISGGSFEAPGSMPVLYLYPSGTAAASATNPGTIAITGGTFYSVKPIVARGGTWNMDVSGATALTTKASGSTVPTYLIEVQDDAVATVTLGNGNNVAANKLVYVRENKGALAKVAVTGGIYTVQTTVLENANPTDCTLTLSGGTVELRGTGSVLYKNTDAGTLTLAAPAGTIKLYSGAVAPIYPDVDMTGIDIVICGVMDSTIVLDTAGSETVAGFADLVRLSANEINKNKSAYKSVIGSCEEQIGWVPVQIKHADAVLKITGGTYSADAGNLITITAGALHISGGSLTTKNYVVYCAANADCSVEIAGGTLTSTAASPLYVRGSGNATVQIAGGTLTAATAYPVLYFYGGGTASTLLVSGGSFYGKYLVQVRCAILESVTVRNVSFTAVKAGSDTKPAGVIYLNDDNTTVAEIGLLMLENVSFALQENLIYYNKQLTPIRLCGEGEYAYTVTVKNCNGTAAKIGEFPAGVEAVDLTVADSVIKCSSYAINFGIQSSYAHKVLLSNAEISTTGRGVLILRGAPDIKGFVTIEGNKTKLTAASNALGLIYGTDTGCYDITVAGGTLLSPTSAPIVMRGEIAMTLHISGGRLQFATAPYESDVPVSGSVCGGVLVHTGTNTIDTLFPDTFTVKALTVLAGYGVRSISSTLEMAQDAKVKYGNTVYYAYIKLLPTSETYDPTNTDTASIGAALDLKQNATNSGIRFTTVLSTEMIALASAAKKAGKQVSYGTLIAPADYVTAAGAFTVEALAALDPLLSTVTYVKIPAVHTLRENASGDVIAFSGALVSIKEKNFDRVFAGVPYVEINGEMHYGSFDTATNARSVRHLAAIALGKSSSYSDEKLALLRTYAKLPLMTDYSIVYNANTSVYMQEQVVSFSQRLSSITGTSHRVSPVSPTAPLTHERGKEILIGNTNRAETATAKTMLGENQYGIFRIGAKIVVLGTTELLTEAAMQLFIDTYLASAPGNELEITQKVMTATTPMELTADYHVIYSALMDDVTRAGITVGRNNEENKDYNYDYPALAATKIYAHAVASGVALPVENLHNDSTAATKEIVVGLCTHSSTALLAEIDVDQYSIKIENGKIYLAALNDAALRAATARFMGMITDGITVVDGKIKVLLPSSYQFTHQLDTKFVTDFPRPAIKGLTLSGSQDVYDDAMLFYYTGGTALSLPSVRTYCATLEANGYTKMTENKADQNLFVTYKHTAKAQLLHVMYMPYPYADSISGHEVDVEPCLRIISAPLNVYTEAPEEMLTQNLGYTKVTNSRITAMTMNWMENTEENLPVRGYGNPYIVTLEDGSFIVIDGGFDVPADRERLVSVLHSLHEESTGSPVSADNPLRIAAWLLTHEHTDHYRLFNWFAKEYGKSKEVKIGYVIGNFPSDEETFNATDVDTTVRRLTRSDFLTYTSNGGMQYIKVHTGQKLYIANAELGCSLPTRIFTPRALIASTIPLPWCV